MRLPGSQEGRNCHYRFNPRTRVGCDDTTPVDFKMEDQFQSTHPRGVRRAILYRNHIMKSFQSTHPRGVRRSFSKSRGQNLRFQSTHPRGVRRSSRTNFSGWSSFNPRTRVGCDKGNIRGGYYGQVSIHAPAWGATFRASF